VRRSRLAFAVPVVAAACAGAVLTVAVQGGAPPPAAAAPPPVRTATVIRADLSTTVLTEGTLGYAPTRPVVNQLAGTYTWLPAAGRTIRPGRALYRVDNLPVVLMSGDVPAWRPFLPGMTSGPDVTELQADLVALGYARGLLQAPTGQFDLLTVYAVERWQAAHGYPATGEIGFGQVVFLPTSIRVGEQYAAPGTAASPGQTPYLATTDRRMVTAPANPDLPPVRAGEVVSIVLPSSATTPGTVTAIGPAAPTGGSGGSGGSGPAAAGSGGAAPASASTVITVRPGRPGATGTGSDVPVQVSLPTQSARGVLVVPVSALLALAGGGYGVEVVTGPGRDRLTGVRTGLFAAGQVAISGPGITAGIKVVVAQ
jgi:peptidoglycan hydrolase-like protein with peptidoglycan-binding domain